MNFIVLTDSHFQSQLYRLPLHRTIGAHLGGVVSGSGLLLLVCLCESSHIGYPALIGAVLLGSLIWSTWVGVTRAGCAPLWLCLVTGTCDLVISLAVCLNLFGRLCPPEGKQFALIPVYFLLCMSRLSIAKAFCKGQWAGWLFASLLLVLIAMDPAEYHVDFRPYSEDSWPPAFCFFSIAVFAIYDGISRWSRLSEELWYLSEFPKGEHRDEYAPRIGPIENCLWALGRSSLLILLSLARGGFLWLFLSPLPTYSSSYSPNYLGAFYGSTLVLSCMLDASVWFQCLQRSMELISRRVYAYGRLVRLQHVLNALLVAAGWAFPLDYPTSSLILRVSVSGAVVAVSLFA